APPRWTRLAGAVALLLALLFLSLRVADLILRADLHWHQATLSQYLHGPGGLLLRTVYVLLAAAVMALAAGLYAQAPPRARSGWHAKRCSGAALGLCGVAIGDSYLPQRAPLLA
ncbi:hypothetical protein, partial [Pantoea dispersa]